MGQSNSENSLARRALMDRQLRNDGCQKLSVDFIIMFESVIKEITKNKSYTSNS